MSIVLYIKYILTGIILIVLLVAVYKKETSKGERDEYSADVLEKAKEYRENGEADLYRKQLEEAELKEYLNEGYDDFDDM